MSRTILLATMLALAGGGLAVVPLSAQGAECEPQYQEAIGLACRAGDLWQVYDEAGRLLGTTHGPDPHASNSTGESGDGWPQRQPHCVDADTSSHYMQVVYTSRSEASNRYEERYPDILRVVRQGNGKVHEAAFYNGVHADLRVACKDGEIDVVDGALPNGGNTLGAIKSGLKSLGHDRSNVKYWIVHEGFHPDYAGIADIHGDDSPGEDNLHNGGEPMYAVTYGIGTNTMLHELGHNLGAVQGSAPNASGGWHCNDDQDVMCYMDGSNQGSFRSDVCDYNEWDCNQNDYFNVTPGPDNYLADHWNIGSRVNRFLHFDGSELEAPDCPLRWTTGAIGTCLLSGGNPETSAVWFELDWGDGATQRVPTTGGVGPGTEVEVSHTYSASGTPSLHVQAFDAAGASARVRLDMEVRDFWRPEITDFDCPAIVERSNNVTCALVADEAEEERLRFQVDWGDGVVEIFPDAWVEPGQVVTISHRYEADDTYAITATAIEEDGSHESADAVRFVQIHTDTTPPQLHVQAPLDGRIYRGCDPTDLRPHGYQGPPIALLDACVQANATDDWTGVQAIWVEAPLACEQDRVVAAAGPALQETISLCQTGEGPMRFYARDGAGNVAHLELQVRHIMSALAVTSWANDHLPEIEGGGALGIERICMPDQMSTPGWLYGAPVLTAPFPGGRTCTQFG